MLREKQRSVQFRLASVSQENKHNAKKFEVKVLAGACEVLRVLGCVSWRIESFLLSNVLYNGGNPIRAPVLYIYSSVFNLALL